MPTALEKLQPKKDFFIGIDSDGCAFDTMEIKHKQCFIPAFINHFNFHSISSYAKETWEFVNLYSRTRGTNRFLGLILTCELMAERAELRTEEFRMPDLEKIRYWVSTETRLGNTTLKKAVEDSKNSELLKLYNWSFEVNKSISKIVRNVPPFPYVKKSLEKISRHADSIVISSANQESLNREWSENELDQYVRFIAGQEWGNKKNCFSQAAADKYSHGKTLMIGDAPGDMAAAKSNNALFFPIIPGEEVKSWELLYNEGLDRFFEGSYSGKYELKLKKEFLAHLPEHPSWRTNLKRSV